MRDAALSFDTKKPSSPSQHVFPKKSGLGSWTISKGLNEFCPTETICHDAIPCMFNHNNTRLKRINLILRLLKLWFNVNFHDRCSYTMNLKCLQRHFLPLPLLQCWHFPAIHAWSAYDRTHDCHTVSWPWMHRWHLTTARIFHSQATWVIGVLHLYFDMLHIGVCTIRHWHTTGLLVQKLNICTIQ